MACQHIEATEAQAGLARVCLAAGDPVQALSPVEDRTASPIQSFSFRFIDESRHYEAANPCGMSVHPMPNPHR
jgi:hypothetical protein